MGAVNGQPLIIGQVDAAPDKCILPGATDTVVQTLSDVFGCYGYQPRGQRRGYPFKEYVQPPDRQRLKSMEREPVKRMNDHRDPGQAGRPAADNAGLGRMGMYDVRSLAAQDAPHIDKGGKVAQRTDLPDQASDKEHPDPGQAGCFFIEDAARARNQQRLKTFAVQVADRVQGVPLRPAQFELRNNVTDFDGFHYAVIPRPGCSPSSIAAVVRPSIIDFSMKEYSQAP
jgi:hypothetical protein